MREILFRGKCGYNDKWVEGFYYQAKLYRSDKELCHYITIPHPECDGQPSDHIMVHPETIGQFTGLTDKTGKKIFEGDIVTAHFRNNRSCQTFKVRFSDGMFLFDNSRFAVPSYDIYCWEVIGNIHDNPELLEK